MSKSRAAVAALLAGAALATAAPAQADSKYDCAGGVERLEAEFREIEAKKGWDAAAKWWDKAWARYYESCVI